MRHLVLLRLPIGLSLLLAATLPTSGAASGFGFAGPEIFPIDDFIGQLRVADLDRDGLMDLVVVNNARARINLLYNQTGRTNTAPASSPKIRQEVNELPPDARFRIDSVASEKRIFGFVVADLNSDSLPDLAYYGDPKELVLQYNLGSNSWSHPKRWPIEDGQLTPNGMVSGDLNGDHRTDLVLLGEKCVYWLAQTPERTLAEPETVPFSSTLKSSQVLDIDGNGRDDLLLVDWDSPNPFRFRLQDAQGQMGPEIYFSMPPIRSYWADDLDGDHKTEIITVAQLSGRAQISNFMPRPAEALAGNFHRGQFAVLPLNRTGKARRGLAWADLNGDQRTDLVVAEPESGQMTVYLQRAGGVLVRSVALPTLTGISDLAVLPGEGETTAEVYLLSQDERQVGVMRFNRDGTAPFPSLIPLEGRPLALAAGRLRPGEPPALAVILDREGQRHLFVRRADGSSRVQKLSENFKSNPNTLAFHDLNQDGLADLVVLIPYEKIKILLHVPDQNFAEEDIAPPGGALEQPWFSSADVDGDGRDELLLAQRNFVRAVVLGPEQSSSGGGKTGWVFQVKDQINGASSRSKILGAAALANGTHRIPSLFLLDGERKALTLCERDTNGIWQIIRNIPVPFTDFQSLQPVAFQAAAPNSIAFLGLNAVAWMSLQGDTWEFVELDGYETPIRDGRLTDVVSGDLNGDGRKDLVFLETAKNYLDLVIFEPPASLVPASRWQVFEQRTFRSRRTTAPEPREAVIVDLTGDGKNDLAVVVHDRILVYPQE